jgi:hypothetical protein
LTYNLISKCVNTNCSTEVLSSWAAQALSGKRSVFAGNAMSIAWVVCKTISIYINALSNTVQILVCLTFFVVSALMDNKSEIRVTLKTVSLLIDSQAVKGEFSALIIYNVFVGCAYWLNNTSEVMI